MKSIDVDSSKLATYLVVTRLLLRVALIWVFDLKVKCYKSYFDSFRARRNIYKQKITFVTKNGAPPTHPENKNKTSYLLMGAEKDIKQNTVKE